MNIKRCPMKHQLLSEPRIGVSYDKNIIEVKLPRNLCKLMYTSMEILNYFESEVLQCSLF